MERSIALRGTAAAGLRLLYMTLVCLAAAACDGSIYDYEGDCSITYRVKFRYDWNMKFADAFAHEVESVTLYVIGEDGSIVWQRTESGEALAAEGYAMTVNVEPGTYDLLAWGGTTDKGSFVIPGAANREELVCRLDREYDDAGSAFVRSDLDRLFHGYLEKQEFAGTEGVYTLTMPLVKDTNNVHVVLQNMSGATLDPGKFSFTVTDDNGSMNWDNSLLADETITYCAWHIDAGQADFEYDTASRASSTISTAVAELTVPRLMEEHKSTARLTVTNIETGDKVLSLRLIDALLLVKGYYSRSMSDQEYLDRQDDYSLIFFLDEGYRWNNAYIYINSWKVVLQETALK